MARPDIRSRSRAAAQGNAFPSQTSSTRAEPSTMPAQKSPARTKQAKRNQRRATLLSRAHASSTATGRHASGIKKRRPTKKLAGADPAGLAVLTNALDDALVDPSSSTVKRRPCRHRLTPTTSLKSKPGMQRRREEINRLEQSRFSQNLAVMNTPRPSASSDAAIENATVTEQSRADKWSALRRHIAASLPGLS